MKKSFFICLCLIVLVSLNAPAQSNPCYPKIKNFAKVEDNYYRSGQPRIGQFKTISQLGIKTMINLRVPFSFNKKGLLEQQAAANSLGMKYVSIPMDARYTPSRKKLDCFFKVLNEPSNLPVLVYNKDGQDRVGLMAGLYRIKYDRWTYDQAYREMKSFGYHKFLYPGLGSFLKGFAKSNCAY